jgi:hypothetical protein
MAAWQVIVAEPLLNGFRSRGCQQPRIDPRRLHPQLTAPADSTRPQSSGSNFAVDCLHAAPGSLSGFLDGQPRAW